MKTAFISLPSPFPVDHRLIYSWPAIAWQAFGQDQSVVGPELARCVEHILALHPAQRGLIHSVSYPRTELLLEWVTDSRVFGHTSGENFDSVLARLITTPGAVLVSPRALEGIDLKGDRSEFQIFIKLPHLSLGDPQTQRRKNSLTNWYTLQTAIGLIQGCGRSVRTATDIAPTYVLDASFPRWLDGARAARLLPPYFLDAVRPFEPLGSNKAQPFYGRNL
jgi:Rad3-related DNA helicase